MSVTVHLTTVVAEFLYIFFHNLTPYTHDCTVRIYIFSAELLGRLSIPVVGPFEVGSSIDTEVLKSRESFMYSGIN
jgi:hypothetical protein